MTVTPAPRPGDLVGPGILIHATPFQNGEAYVVLAIVNQMTPRAEYVTWIADVTEQGTLYPYSGTYTGSLTDAVADYTRRGGNA
jgi:hypothetical protein